MLASVLFFIFLLGCCVGSFLNVVVYRLPLGKSLVTPPSTCPKCNTRLAWHDNVPVLGWLWLGGKCRTCKLPISMRYPIVEGACGLLFLGYAWALFRLGWGPCLPVRPGAMGELDVLLANHLPDITRDWPVLVVHLVLLAVLLAASLIDLETFTIPISLPITAAAVGLLGHTLLVSPNGFGSLTVGHWLALPSAGAVIGYGLALVLWRLRIIPLSFPDGEPMQLDQAVWAEEIELAKKEGREPNVPLEPPVRWSRGMLNREMMKEITFITPALAGFVLGMSLTRMQPGLADVVAAVPYLNNFLGAALAGLVGGFVIWAFRIAGTIGFGKLAMGLGDVHLMAGVGCCVGGTIATCALFAGAVWGLLFTVYGFLTRRQREIPFGPYLALGTVTCMLAGCYLERQIMNVWDNLANPTANASMMVGPEATFERR